MTQINRRNLLRAFGLTAAALRLGRPAAALAAAPAGVSYGWNPGLAAPTDASCYVSPDGNDGAAGRIDSPLRTIQAGVDRLIAQGAGSLAIRGGVYREAASLRNLAGARDQPILIHRYGSEPVTISAAEVLTGWQPCTARDEAALGVALKGVFVVRFPRDRLDHGAPMALNPHEAGQWLSVATLRADMDQLDSPSDDRRFFTAPALALSPDGRVQGFADPRIAGLTPAQMQGVRLLFHHAPNIVTNDPIAGYDAASGSIRLVNQGQKVQRENNKPVLRYALQNISTGLTRGRWLVREEDEGKTVALYLYPNDPANLEGGIQVSVRGFCLDLGSASFVTLAGIDFIRAAGETLRTGIAISHVGAGPVETRAHDISILHCRVAETMSSASRGEGAMFIRGVTNLTMRNFTMERVRGAFGVALHDCVGTDLRNLHLTSISQSAGRFFGARQMIFAFSLIENCGWEAHANKFNFYQGSDQILVYGIRTRDTGGYVTYQKASRIHFAFCEFDASASNPDNRALASQNRGGGNRGGGQDTSGDPFPGGTFWYWNLLLAPQPHPDDPPKALTLGPGGTSQRHAYHNCILYGGGFADIYQKGANPALEQRSYNLYTGLAFWQSARFNWRLGDHEAQIAPGASPRAAGRDMRDVIAAVSPMFPAFTDWDRDIDFRPINWAAAPIGCSAY
ncbi:MAG: hypothetical protein JSR87_00255 [Proteobacteria bacterium]|nr:hypothetical protein [Pseudomonadota bacterium]MBS0573063.1 hypothetical protein [Pseudomonadota bacterium]